MMNNYLFKNAKGSFKKQFKLVYRLFIYSYHEILKNETINDYDEDKLRNLLVKYARKYQSKFGVSNLYITGEIGEFPDETMHTPGLCDIKLIDLFSLVNDGIIDYDKNYTIECKRLDKYASKSKKYVEEGMLRYINKKYSINKNLAGMIGFVETGVIKDIVNKINHYLNENNKIQTIKYLKYLNIDITYNHTYDSEHKRENIKSIELIHLLLDYSLIINH